MSSTCKTILSWLRGEIGNLKHEIYIFPKLIKNYLVNRKNKGRSKIEGIFIKYWDGLSQVLICVGRVKWWCLGGGRGEIYFNRRASWFDTDSSQQKSMAAWSLAFFSTWVNLSPLHNINGWEYNKYSSVWISNYLNKLWTTSSFWLPDRQSAISYQLFLESNKLISYWNRIIYINFG